MRGGGGRAILDDFRAIFYPKCTSAKWSHLRLLGRITMIPGSPDMPGALFYRRNKLPSMETEPCLNGDHYRFAAVSAR